MLPIRNRCECLQKKNEMKAMILAAGFGSRLQPLTDHCPKPLFPVCNRPLLQHSLDFLEREGIGQIAINLHHLAQAVVDGYPTRSYNNLDLRFFIEEKILGTAGGIRAAQEFLDEGSPFLALNSDILSDVNIKDVLKFHKERQSALTLVVRRYGPSESYRPIEIDATGRIVNFLGAIPPDVKETGERVMFTGIQIMEPEIFARIPAGKFCGTTEDIFPQMIREGNPVYGYLHEGYWIDAGTRETYLQANFDVLDKAVSGQMQKSQDPEIIHPVLIGKHCELSPSASIGPYVILGDHCKVGSGTKIERSICWERSEIAENCHIEGSVISGLIAPGSVVKGSLVGKHE
ncbi:MAG: hypothetical protein COV66_12110 [Nitrospinae bacterium CG11_big_fil_rev_8_21_14_0_20_45_15]|nr:MAG: hypothetical protein COV66_12110 [Nitrospinae bacterium CG11_big_fil_rev_8_21_14_0_20_45_15]